MNGKREYVEGKINYYHQKEPRRILRIGIEAYIN
jgi:hypothetical protein